ncbi:hypothetical protein Rleg10DRAFT_0214 [Rhizobium leguminosarum bv. trifolii WSM2012]|nr:hypothetical protein Rleg10DRAFT_0214 [Rhizobium leguminosarum bv. trifolii WSM2012]
MRPRPLRSKWSPTIRRPPTNSRHWFGGKVKATLSSAMTSAQQSMLDKLNGLQGYAFNKQYHSDQDLPTKTRSICSLWRLALEQSLEMAKELNK